MLNINCKLFGYPLIIEDGIKKTIPSGKVSAMLYYILLKRTVSRDELANLFWNDVGEKNAKISLRNALHKIRKSFKNEIILSPNKTILILNEEIKFNIDVNKFEENPLENLELYTGDFLKSLYVKDAVDFEYWHTELSSFYKELFIKNSEKKIEEFYKEGNKKESEDLINKILAIDNLNEISYLYLMKMYKENNRFDKMINEYHNLKKLMDDELGIEPPQEIENLYNEALGFVKKAKSDKNNRKKEFYSRTFEIETINEILNNFYEGKGVKSVVISGETGLGKSFLKNKILSKNINKFNIYEATCFSVESNLAFFPWLKIIKLIENDFIKNNLKRPPLWEKVLNNLLFDSFKNIHPIVDIVENKDNFTPDLIYSYIFDAFNVLGLDKKSIVIFEDIQWMDQISIKLLASLILHSNSNILFIITKSDENIENSKFLVNLKDLEKLSIIDLKPFDKTEVSIILKKILGKKISEKEIEDIFIKSKGNAFFLSEYIELFKNGEKDKILSSKMKNILENKFLNLNNTEMDIVRVISIFYGNVTVDDLVKMLDLKPFVVLKSLDNLRKLNIIFEKKENNNVVIKFTYSAYRNFIYNNLSDSSKQIVNREIINILEKELTNNTRDITVYNKLKYHYQELKQEIEALKYEIHILNYYLNFNHEIYPSLRDYNYTQANNLFISNEKVLRWIDDIEKKLFLIKNSEKSKNNYEKIKNMENLYTYCKSRYLIRAGRYSEGIKEINKVISLSIELKDIDIELRGYKQLIIYGIQVNDREFMLKNIIKGIKLSKKENNTLEQGIFYRLYGLYNIMSGDFKTAESLFKKSILQFIKSKEIELENPVSIAANYNYIGEIRKADKKYKEALFYFQKAVKICKNKEVACLSIFYINMAKISYLISNLSDMKKYLILAKEIVDKFDLHWRVPVLESFLALKYFKEKDYLQTIQYLKSANFEKKIINNTRDAGIIYFVETIIANDLKKIEDAGTDLKELREFLAEAVSIYYYNALKYLDAKRDVAEIDYLKSNILY